VLFQTEAVYNSVNSMVKATIDKDKTTLSKIINSGSKQIVQLHITEAIATYVSLLSNSKGVSNQAILTMGEYLTDNKELQQLSVCELKTFINLAFKQQQYGKLYGGFGYDVLLDWLNQFLDERFAEVMNVRDNQHRQHTTFEKQRRSRSEGDAFGSIKSVYKGGNNG
jgi:hypothetical protein